MSALSRIATVSDQAARGQEWPYGLFADSGHSATVAVGLALVAAASAQQFVHHSKGQSPQQQKRDEAFYQRAPQ
jgi:hypothetical protein